MSEPSPESRPPRGALIVIAVGLIACIAAALLATDKGEGEAAHLEWVRKTALPDSKPVAVPGGGGEMRLGDGAIRTTGTNVSGYSIFRVSETLRIDKGAPVGGGRIVCTVHAGGRAEIGRSSGGLRTVYPRSSIGLFNQEVPEVILVDFSSHGGELAVVELDGLPAHFSTAKGVKVEWPEYQPGTEHIEYFLPKGKLKEELALPFETVWRSTTPPAAQSSCTLTTSAGKATVRSAGELAQIAPPIDEEAEAENQEQAEEEAADDEGEEEAAEG